MGDSICLSSPGPGSCEEVKLRVLQFTREAEEIVTYSNSSRFPLGESFLAAKGIQLTDEELEALAAEIGRTGIAHIFTGHCTGDHAFEFLKERLGERIAQFSSGFRYRFG